MFYTIINSFKNLDKLIKKIMKIGLNFCSIIGLVALIVLITYNITFTFPIVFTIGLVLFKLSLIWSVEFIICGLAVDGIKKQLI